MCVCELVCIVALLVSYIHTQLYTLPFSLLTPSPPHTLNPSPLHRFRPAHVPLLPTPSHSMKKHLLATPVSSQRKHHFAKLRSRRHSEGKKVWKPVIEHPFFQPSGDMVMKLDFASQAVAR